ncbi:MAG: DUF3784 domain-containing protein [Bacillota bacterium]
MVGIAVANFIGGLLTLFFGILIRVFKLSNLIAGYNTASKEEKAKYNEEKLTKFVGNLLILSSLVLFLGGMLAILVSNKAAAVNVSWIVFTLVIVGGVIYMNTGNRFRN